MLTDSNDSPPVCESSLYRASLDEGAIAFEPPLIIKVRDADATTEINYRYLNSWIICITHTHKRDGINHFEMSYRTIQSEIVESQTDGEYQLQFECIFSFRILGNDNIQNLFAINSHTGQLFIKDTVALDVNHLKSENIFFSVEVICFIGILFMWMRSCGIKRFKNQIENAWNCGEKSKTVRWNPKALILFPMPHLFEIQYNGILWWKH